MVDDQTDTFTADILRQMKSDHEVWVSQKLEDEDKPKPLRVRRVEQNIPSFLSHLTTGKEVLDLVSNAMAYDFDHDEPESQEEVDLLGGFLQTAQDWGDISADLQAGDRVRAAYGLTERLRELEDNGFVIFGARELRLLEGGIQPEPSGWPIAILRVLRQDNEAILRVNLDEKGQEQPNKIGSS